MGRQERVNFRLATNGHDRAEKLVKFHLSFRKVLARQKFDYRRLPY